jgi:hypothetical protein
MFVWKKYSNWFIIKSLWNHVSTFTFGIYSYVKSIMNIKKAKIIKELKTPEEKYISNRKGAFLKTYDEDDHMNKYNLNISFEYYSMSEYNKTIDKPNSWMELEWRRRLLYENTPRGNIIMYYDAYKHGFAYYSDTYIPYSILNGAAMKYSSLYRCRDFFIDEQVVPATCRSPFIKMVEDDEAASKKKKEQDLGVKKIDVNKGPFAKLKKYKTGNESIEKFAKDVVKRALNGEEIPINKDLIKNRFIHLGKIANYSFLQKSVEIKKDIPNSFAKMLFDKDEAQDSVFSYRDFKNIYLR